MSPISIFVQAAPAFFRGLLTTLEVWVVSFTLGTLIGCVLGWVRFNARGTFEIVTIGAEAIPAVVKAIPLIVLLVWFHYLVPGLLEISPSAFETTVIVFTIYVAVSVSDIFLSAFVSIPTSEIDAAYALGLSARDVANKVALPLAARSSIPSLSYLAVEVLKLTTLASIIALGELLHVTDTVIASNYVALSSYTVLAFIFVAMILPLQLLAGKIARKYAIFR
jgi:polar amino acid transport system permease protein